MEIGTILIALPIFILAYQVIGMLFDTRKQNKWVNMGTPETSEQFGNKTAQEITQFTSKFTFNRLILRYERLNERLDLLLLRSGHPFGWKPENLLFFKEVLGLLFVAVCWRVDVTEPFIYIIAFVVGFWIPDIYIQNKIADRQSSIQKQLPGFVDLMALTLEGGLDFLAAVERIMEKLKKTFLKEELNVLLQECRLGTPRKEALQHLAFRVNLPDIQSFASMVIQSEELGTSLAGVLRNYAEDMRSKRILRAEEQAGKAPVKLLFPMMVFFFPIVFVIIFGPIALNYMGTK